MDDNLAELLTLTRSVNDLGRVEYRNHHGQLHRVHGPALITHHTQCWYFNGRLHREGGPAVMCPECQMWYTHGKFIHD